MTERKLDRSAAVGEQLASLDGQELCRLVIRLCEQIAEQNGTKCFHGGIYPDNIKWDENGQVSVGTGRGSGWEGQELQFVPPELYWDATASPAGDVYSLGLLLYYGVSGGKLPLEGESPNAQLSRMSGAAFAAPAEAGPRLGEIIEKALSFRAEDRYADVKELQIQLESCLEHKYLGERAGEELFRKNEEQLSEVERMMLDIIGGVPMAVPAEEPIHDEPELIEKSAGEPEPTETETLSEEEAAELILGGAAAERETPDREAEMRALVDEVFGEAEDEAEDEAEAAAQEASPDSTRAEQAVFPEEDEEPEDVRVYEPAKEKKDHVPIPILTEEKNPELAPVVPNRTNVHYSRSEERNKQIAQDVKKRRTRPIGVVLILCGLLIIAALVANEALQRYEFDDEGAGRQIEMPQVGETAISSGEGFVSAEELQRQEEAAAHQSYYQVFRMDISWTDAKNACTDLGGKLAVINTQDEFTMVTQLAQQSGVQGIWVGCHRESGFLQWETQEPVGTMSWAENEPSYTDSRDGAAEDYIMLWNTGDGWAYIDCRNDPVFADPGLYQGVIGYVCEFEN